jgi:ATP-dependent Clp protease adaptor protein ClpS
MLSVMISRRGNVSIAEGLAAGPPGDDDRQPPVDPAKERDRGVATKKRSKSERPPRFKVILYNDDYTPMEFVVQILEKVFGKSPSAATQIMLQIHKGGMGVAGVYVLEVAETKSAAVQRMAEERGYPLRCGVEKE